MIFLKILWKNVVESHPYEKKLEKKSIQIGNTQF